ncbi:acyltransferase family protein [Amnibacterium endophyticum]|uniref:Acyltransferase family protein n=1 Tax=Amnibacterium endophyticum TaxID=2109337 RepID=A0ABW4LB95_9MICO
MAPARPLSPALPERLSSLDGLRGVAAVVVLVHHALLTVPLLARAYADSGASVPEGTLAWWLAYSPLHLAWAGREAVFLFFVLSGVVVTLPALRSPGFDWVAFYPRRIVRIYGPVAAALAFGLVLTLLVPRFNDHVLGHWMNSRPNTVSVGDVLKDLVLVDGSSGTVSPLWSLQWEMLFSAFLPFFVAIALLVRRRPRTVLAVVTAALVLGSFYSGKAMFYLAMFAIGAVLVGLWDRVARLGRRMSTRRWAWPVVVLAALLCTSAVWSAQGLGVSAGRAERMSWIAVPGVVALLLAAAFWRPAVRLLDTRLLQWLGRISFSLYLVHEPIVIAVRFLLVRHHVPTAVSIAIAIPLALLAAVLFAWIVEQPFHRLARRAGKAVAAASRELVQSQRTRADGPPVTSSVPVVVRGAAVARPATAEEPALR